MQFKPEQTLAKILDDACIPALSMAWRQKNTVQMLAGGLVDTSDTKRVDNLTRFQAASLSKPVSAAIVLDLVSQKKWDLDTPLAEIMDYGPPDLCVDPHYRVLTTRMVIGQCSGLPNWFYEGSVIKFIAQPGKQFNYSGAALQYLKEIIEKQLQTNWETIAQTFFAKVGMKHSTYKQLHHLNGDLNFARGHDAESNPEQVKPEENLTEIPAASLYTTASDYLAFLEYCFLDEFLKATLLTGITPLDPDGFPNTPFAPAQIQWGLGMGIFTDGDKTIAFHWGNNPYSHAFCAMNLQTGESIASFINSVNGPNVFQQLTESVIGDLTSLFNWLSNYCCFNAQKEPKIPNTVATLFQSLNSEFQLEVARNTMQRYKEVMVEDSGIGPKFW